MTRPVAEAGYYVIPVTLMEASFRENGVYNGADAQAINPKNYTKYSPPTPRYIRTLPNTAIPTA